ncbi:peptidoglycan-binding protein [Actinokineospora sp. UTMC 2448]|uniref:peptidoglycan-binding domain-containing protein n=1 Tax=Actinokineospora sp. UTMC 2448 TaxID=2268449 RepID=UPI0021646119|nr:peptidoglycan-binding protein [Actinokineospora sp. UTMC 2448]UVS77763.1 Putative peptidoglycan binding domain protein [Actinokineospora sp. UTMC 2448]
MGNPELRQDSDQEDWVKYLQGLLADRLAAEAEAGEVRLSRVDGKFGPITRVSVEFFQRREGLPGTGVVDDATWEALEREPAQPPSSTRLQPLNLRIPFHLWLRWEETTIERMLDDFRDFDLTTHPGAQLRLNGSGVGPLAGNGSVELLNREIRLWPNWFLRHTHQFTLDWSRAHGFELGLDNEADFGVRPMRNFEITLHGEFNLQWTPRENRGDFDWYVGPRLKWEFELVR